MSDSNVAPTNIGLLNLPDVPKSVDTAIGNLTDKPTNAIGTTLADIWFLVFGGLSKNAEIKRLKYAQDINDFKTVLESKTSKIPIDKRVDPDIRIVGPALEGIKYSVGSEELREMFSNLIASSMNSDISESVHPSFVEIIKQLSPVEAIILKFISDQNGILPLCRITRRVDKSITDSTPKRLFASGEDFLITGDSGSVELRNYHYMKFYNESPETFSSYIDNLTRLGLLDVSYGYWFTKNEFYEPFLNDSYLLRIINEDPFKFEEDYLVYKVSKGSCRFTSLGNLFIKVCVLG